MMNIFRSIVGYVRRHRVLSVIGAIVTILLLTGIYFLFKPKPPQYVTASVTRGNLTQVVEAVGTVTSERDLALQLPVSGVVAKVLVREGDKVKAGQQLALLRSGQLAASVASAAANVQSAEAQLRLLQEGSRPEDIVIAEEQLRNKQAALDVAKTTLSTSDILLKNEQQELEAIKQEVDTNLSGYITTAGSTVSQRLATANSSLAVIDGVLNDVDVRDAYNYSSDQAQYDILKAQQNSARSAIDTATARPSATSYRAALDNLQSARTAVNLAASTVDQAYSFIANLPLTSYFTSSDREARKATLSTEKTSVQTALAALDSAIKSLQDASASYDTRITTQQSAIASAQGTKEKAQADIETYQTAIRIQQAQLDLLRAGSRPADIDAAAARVKQARADLARASAQYSDTILTAPIDGTVTKVEVKVGEYTPTGAAVSMLGTSPYRVEMFASEIDIPLVTFAQSGSIELDAFPDKPYALTVSEIDRAATEIDNVSKYRVKLDFLDTHEEIKIGMKGDVTIVTGERINVLNVPGRAVITNDQGQKVVRVLDKNGDIEERPVVTGLETETDTEILSGLKEGETIVVLVKS